MALGTLAELQAALTGWLGDRTDLVDQLPTFIALAEEDLRQRLRCRELHERAVALLTEEYEWLPEDFGALDELAFGSGNGDRVRLHFRTMAQLDNDYHDGQTAEAPAAYATIGAQIRFAPAPTPFAAPPGVDPDLEPQKCRHFELVYWRRLAPLTTPESTSIVLQTYPRLYLYGALVAAEPFILNDQRLPMWQAQYAGALDAANDSMKDSRATMQVSMPENAP